MLSVLLSTVDTSGGVLRGVYRGFQKPLLKMGLAAVTACM